MKKIFLNYAILAIGIGFPLSAHAQILVDVQFGGNTFTGYQAVAQTGAAGTGLAGDQWNYVNASGAFSYSTLTTTGLSLNTTAGTSSGITIKGNSSIVGAFATTSAQVTDPSVYNLFQGYIVPVAADNTLYSFKFSGLQANSSYSLYVYSAADAGNYRTSIFSTDGINFQQVGPGNSLTTTLNNPLNYTVLSGVTDGAGTFTLQAEALNNSGELDINGFQLSAITAAVPEPSTYAMMGMGLVALCIALRRKSAV